MSEYLWNLMVKKVANEASPKEVEVFQQQLDSSKIAQQHFREIHTIWNTHDPSFLHFDSYQAFQKLDLNNV